MIKKPILHFLTGTLPRLRLLILLFLFSNKVQGQCQEYKLRAELKDGLYGAVDIATGRVVIPYQFQKAQSFPGNYMAVAGPLINYGNLWGLVNEKGEFVLKTYYKQIVAPECGRYAVVEDSTFKLFDQDFKVIKQFTAGGIIPFLQFNRVLATKKKDETSFEFKLLDPFTGKVYYTGTHNASVSRISKALRTGGSRDQPFFSFRHSSNQPQRNSSSQQDLKSILDMNGNILFDSLNDFSMADNFARIYRKNQVIVTDSNFKVVPGLSYQYDQVQPLTNDNNIFWVVKNGKTGIADWSGKLILPVAYEGSFSYAGKDAFEFRSNKAGVPSGIYFADGRVLDLSNHYPGTNFVTPQGRRLLLLTNIQTHKKGIMDYNGNFIIPQEFDNLRFSLNNRIIFVKGREAGYLDFQGKVLLSGDFRAIGPMQEGLAQVAMFVYGTRKDYPMAQITSGSSPSYATRITFIDSTGNKFPGGYYDWASGFKDGMAHVEINGKIFTIDKKGQPIKFGKYFLLSHFNQDVAIIRNKRQTRYGLVHRSGKILTKPIYHKAEWEQLHTIGNTSAREVATTTASIFIPKIKDGKVRFTKENKITYIDQDVFVDIKP